MKQRLIDGMLSLLRYELCQGEEPNGEERQFLREHAEALYKLSKAHDVAHLVASAMKRMGLLGDDESSQRFAKQQMLALYRSEHICYELTQITALFEKRNIPFMPLKGAVLRPLYPEPWMRTSCDIDVLVREEDLERGVAALMEALEYRSERKKGPHDVQLYSPSNVHIELHYNLVEDHHANEASRILSKIWTLSHVKSGTVAHYEMRSEILYLYHLAHMAKHFQNGGCGIKPFLDMVILDQKIEYDQKVLDTLLKDSGLLTFANAARELTDVWFRGAKHTALTKKMEGYVISGGVYGSLTNSVVVRQGKRGGKVRYAWSRIFLPFDTLKFYYPILQRRKWLFPLMQVRRWGRLIFCGGMKRSITELRINQDVSKEAAEQMQSFFGELEL